MENKDGKRNNGNDKKEDINLDALIEKLLALAEIYESCREEEESGSECKPKEKDVSDGGKLP